MTNIDPIEGQYGSLLLSGWIGRAPTGRDEAFLLLTTPDPRAGQTMPVVAAMAGIRIGRVTEVPPGLAVVALGEDNWVTLTVGGVRMDRLVGADWTRVARVAGQVALVIGAEPMAAEVDADTYTQRHGDQCGIGLVSLESEGRGRA